MYSICPKCRTRFEEGKSFCILTHGGRPSCPDCEVPIVEGFCWTGRSMDECPSYHFDSEGRHWTLEDAPI